jgi:hypothetical protein
VAVKPPAGTIFNTASGEIDPVHNDSHEMIRSEERFVPDLEASRRRL